MPQGRVHSTSSSSYNVLYRFDEYPNGESPSQGLTNVGGTLYGTTFGGGVKACVLDGKRGCGTVFSITPTGTETLLYSFTPSTGAHPDGRLLDVKGALYGTTYKGGIANGAKKGTIYSVSTSGSEKVLYYFPGANRGAGGGQPRAGMIALNGTFYGTTTDDGGFSKDSGKVYSFTASGQYNVLHTFPEVFKRKSDGAYPQGDLVAVNGTLYGTTIEGGGSACNSYRGCGTVFSITSSGKEKVLYAFGGPDGQSPNGDLLNVNGTLYGTTYRGGGSGCFYGGGCGNVYTITTSGKESVLYKFLGGSDGGNPASGLIDVNGTLYGTTFYGGGSSACTNGCGTVYSISTSGVEKVLYAFAGGNDGQWPQAPLTSLQGTLYGETSGGGDSQQGKACCGTVFALTP
jgi:uncharacterized repeat protein (TIGR03803 family)